MTEPATESTFDRHRRLFTTGSSTDRIVGFSDGVFGIALTLLVLELRVPESIPAGLGPALIDLVPNYLAFVLSFAVVGATWMSHHRKFRAITGFDQNLMRLNLLMLLFVASVPFPTALLARHGDDPLAAAIYAACLALLGFCLAGLWTYAWHRGLVDPSVSRDVARFVLAQSLLLPTVFVLSIPVAMIWGATASELSWIVAVPALSFMKVVFRRAEGHHPADAER